MRLLLLAVALCLSVMAAAEDTAPRPLEDDTARPRIIDGTNVNASVFPTVGIIGDGLFGVDSFYCSGTLIASKYVVTAAHCVCDSFGQPILAGTDGRFRLGGTTYKTSRIYVHSTYAGDFSFLEEGNFDVALFELDTAVTSVTPTQLYLPPAAAPANGMLLTIAGYGLVGEGRFGVNENSLPPPEGTIEFGTTTIQTVSPTFIKWVFDDLPPPSNEANTSPGDSGGPAFLNDGGTLKLVAVTTGGSNFDASFGDNSFDTRVDSISAWINRVTAGQSPNDSFADALALFGTQAQDTVKSTACSKETGEPNHAGDPGGASLWWRWTASNSGQVTVTTTGSDFDTLLAVYQGKSVDALTLVGSNNDDNAVVPTNKTSTVLFNAVAGKTYRIAVDGVGGAEGTVRVTLSQQGSADLVVSSIESTPLFPYPGEEVTFIVTVYNQGTVDASCNVNFFPHRDTPPGLNDLSQFGDFSTIPAGGKDVLFFEVTAQEDIQNAKAWVFVDSYLRSSEVAESNEGNNTLSYDWQIDKSLVNDAFAAATELQPVDPLAVGTNANATKEPGEPNHAGKPGGRSIWFKWKAPASGFTSVSTSGSNFDTLLAVYTGSSVSTLTEVGSNDDKDGDLASSLDFEAVAGRTYYIAVDGVNRAFGRVLLGMLTPEANDLTIDRAQIRFNLKTPDKDSLTMSGSLELQPAFTTLKEKACALLIGDFRLDFTLDEKNKSSNKAFRLRPGRGGTAKFNVNLRNVDLLSPLRSLGFSNANVTNQFIEVPVTLLIGPDGYSASLVLNYNAKAGTSGQAK
ncbi:MAG TPA: trypsin-like serine protease [Planctomycetota bacterium]|nr:trypsin-like serine protease [Planctomycetota bacterium]